MYWLFPSLSHALLFFVHLSSCSAHFSPFSYHSFQGRMRFIQFSINSWRLQCGGWPVLLSDFPTPVAKKTSAWLLTREKWKKNRWHFAVGDTTWVFFRPKWPSFGWHWLHCRPRWTWSKRPTALRLSSCECPARTLQAKAPAIVHTRTWGFACDLLAILYWFLFDVYWCLVTLSPSNRTWWRHHTAEMQSKHHCIDLHIV